MSTVHSMKYAAPGDRFTRSARDIFAVCINLDENKEPLFNIYYADGRKYNGNTIYRSDQFEASLWFSASNGSLLETSIKRVLTHGSTSDHELEKAIKAHAGKLFPKPKVVAKPITQVKETINVSSKSDFVWSDEE